MDNVKLMNRIDTKYVTTVDRLETVLAQSHDRYLVLETDGRRMHGYDSMYYDTASMAMYLMHHNGRLGRHKIRTRTYLDSGKSFLEIKRKDNHARSIKKRISIDDPSSWMLRESTQAFISDHSPYVASNITPSLRTGFKRITLVDRARTERITIDTGLVFENPRTGISCADERLVIIELKQSGHGGSMMQNILRDKRIRPYRISKYCLGCMMTDPGLKRNRFISKLRYIEKLTSKQLA